MTRLFICCALVALLRATLICAVPVPRFENYLVHGVYREGSKAPDVGKMDIYGLHACFGGDPGAQAGRTANFAGHYVLQACSCGSGCHGFVMWDAATGKVFDHESPLGPINVGPYYDSSRPGAPLSSYEGESYRFDSRLLVIEGCREQTCDCAKRYFEWTGSKFRLILRQPVQMPAECVKK